VFNSQCLGSKLGLPNHWGRGTTSVRHLCQCCKYYGETLFCLSDCLIPPPQHFLSFISSRRLHPPFPDTLSLPSAKQAELIRDTTAIFFFYFPYHFSFLLFLRRRAIFCFSSPHSNLLCALVFFLKIQAADFYSLLLFLDLRFTAFYSWWMYLCICQNPRCPIQIVQTCLPPPPFCPAVPMNTFFTWKDLMEYVLWCDLGFKWVKETLQTAFANLT